MLLLYTNDVSFPLTYVAGKELQQMYFAPAKLILIVEDDADIGYLLVQIIHQQTPHRAIHHITAGDALKAITTQTPHLFILAAKTARGE